MDTKKLWTGAAQAGAGIGLLGVLMNILRSSDRVEKAVADDDALVLRLPKQKPVEEPGLQKVAFITKLLIASGITAGSIYAVNQLANRIRENRLKKDIFKLENTQDEQLGQLAQLKQAADEASATQKYLMTPAVQIALLSMLASGAATYATLRNAFPKREVSLNKDYRPKRVVIEGQGSIEADGKPDGPLADSFTKLASFDVTAEDQLRAESLAFRLAADLCKEAGVHTPLFAMACSPALENNVDMLGSQAITDAPSYSEAWGELSGAEKLEKAAGVMSNPLLSPSAGALILGGMRQFHPELTDASAGLGNHKELYPILVKAASCIAADSWKSTEAS